MKIAVRQTVSSPQRIWTTAVALASGLLICGAAMSATTSPPSPAEALAAEQDHQNMMDRLGVQQLRPEPSGNVNAPNHANYDEASANPYPTLPDVLTTKDGHKVTTAGMWRNKRRPEIVEDLEREVYGRVPADVPAVDWTAKISDNETVGDTPVVIKRLTGHVDNSSYPAVDVNITMTLITPKAAKKPVPVLMMFALSEYPAPPLPSRPSLGSGAADPSPIEQLIADGWGVAMISPASIQADNGAGLARGIIGLVDKGQRRKPDDWGALRAWGWGAGRGLDYLESDPAVDAKHVGIEGVSRFGKAALVTMAFDQRFAMVLIGSSGKGGTTLLRRNWGEAVENLTGGEYYWMAGNFIKYGAAKATFGSKTSGDLPVDSHELIALCAPRLAFVSYGIPEQGDPKWLDQQGSFMATVAAQPVFKLLGAKGLGIPDDYRAAKMPSVNTGLLGGQLAWRQHDGGHTDAPNMKYFIKWADKLIGHRAP